MKLLLLLPLLSAGFPPSLHLFIPVVSEVAAGSRVEPPASPQDLGSLIDSWRSDDPAARDKATETLLSRWKELTERDLAALDEAAKSADSETARRAADAAGRIRIKRKTAHLFRRFPDIDIRLHDGDPAVRLKILEDLVNFWIDDRLFDEELAPVIELALDRKWEFPPLPLAGLARHSRAPFLAPLLRPLLRSPDAEVRTDALEAARELRDRRLAADAAVLLGDADNTVRATAAEVIGVLGSRDHVPRLVELLKDGDREVRWNAVWSLGKLKAIDRAPKIAALLKDKEPGVRDMAASTLGRLEARDHLDAVRELLADPIDFVRASAVTSFFRLGGTAELIEPLLRDSSPKVRMAAAEQLPITKIVALAKDPSSTVRLKFVDLAAAAKSAEIAEHVCALVADHEVVHAALVFAIELGWKGDPSPLIALVKSHDDNLANSALQALLRSRHPGAAAGLKPLLASKDPQTRIRAMEALDSLDADGRRAEFLRLLNDPDLQVRSKAAQLVGGPDAIECALRFARSEDAKTRGMAFALGLPADEGVKLLKDPSPLVRRRAANAMPADAVAPLVDDPDAEVQAAAIITVAKAGRSESAGRILAHAAHASAAVRVQVAWAIGELRLVNHAPILETLLGAPELDVVYAAIDALVRLDAPGTEPALRKLLRSEDVRLRRVAAWALGRLRAVDSAGAIAVLLDDPITLVRSAAADALGRLGIREHAPAVARLLDDESDWTRETAIEALGRLGDIDSLLPELRRRSARVRRGVIETVAQIDPSRCADRLVPFLRDKHVAEAAALALGRTGDVRHVEALLAGSDITSAAAEALGWLGARDDKTVASLRELESHGSSKASWALVRLGLRKPDPRLLESEGLFEMSAMAGATWNTPRELAAPIATWADARAFVEKAGLKLEIDPASLVTLRIPAGRKLSPLDLLDRLLDRDDLVIVDGDIARVMPREKALAAWKKRFKK